MPNEDLGTARARIRVDSDTRGADKAEKSVRGFARAVSLIADRLAGFQAAMDRIETELNQVTRDFDQADKAANKFERDMSKARGTTVNWSRDLKDLHNRVRFLSEAAATFGPAAVQVLRFRNAFSDTRPIRAFGENLNFVQRSLRSFLAIGGATMVLDMLKSRFIGTGAAMATITGPMRDVVRLASGFQTLAFATTVVGGLASRFGLVMKAMAGLTVVAAPLTALLARHGKTWTDMIAPLDGVLKHFDRGKGIVKSLWQNMDGLAGSTIRAVGGFALMRSQFGALIQRFSILNRLPILLRVALAAAFTFGEAAVQAFSAALRGASNLLVGLLDGVKQLAGGFLVLPGVIASIVTAFGTLKLITTGIKDNFGDILKAKDAAEMAEAIKALPDALKPFGQALADVLPAWKQLKTDVTATFLSGADTQLRLISDAYLPRMKEGLLQVSNSWKIAKDRALEFVASAQTQSDLNRNFMNTSQIMNQLSGNIAPVLSGLRDIAIVGQEFLRTWVAGLPGVTAQFEQWAAVNRENGNLMRWMQDAWQGVKDLTSGLLDAGKAAWTLLTLFATNDGSNFLSRFADAMERFNQTVQNSASGGVLKQIADSVKSMGTDKLKEFWEIMKDVGKAIMDLLPFIKQMSDAFRATFIPALQTTIAIVTQVIEALSQMGLGYVLGGILGAVAAFKTLAVVLGPIKNLVVGIFGAIQLLKGGQGIVVALAGMLENFGGAGKKASSAILGIGDTLAGLISKVTIATAVVGGLFLAYQSGQDYIKRVQTTLDEASQHADQFHDSLSKAFMADRGATGGQVFTTIHDSLNTMMADLKSAGSQVPGLWQNIVAAFDPGRQDDRGSGFFDQRNPFFQGKQFNDMQKATQDAAKASAAFQRMGVDTQSLTSIVTGSNSIFDQFANALRNSGDGGAEAANKLQQMRDQFAQMQRDFEEAGPGAIKLSEGIKEIANAAGDSQSKLNGLRSALEGLGLLQTSNYEAAFAYAEAIKGLGDAAANAVDKTQSLDDILDASGQNLNTNSVNAQNLFNVLSPLADKFLNLASKGGNVNQMWQDMQPQLRSLADSFGLTYEQVQNLVGQLGVVPNKVDILLLLEGKDKVTQDLATIALWAEQNIGKGINVPIIVQDPKGVEAQIESIFGDIADSTDNAIRFKFNVDPGALEVLKQTLASQGVSLDGAQVNNPATVPVKPQAPTGPLPANAPPPPAPKVTVDQTEIENYKKTIDDLKAKLDELNNKPAKIQVDTGNLAEIKTKIQEIENVVKDGKLEFTIVAKGYDETTAVLNQVKNAVTGLLNEVAKIPGAFQSALQGAGAAITGFSATLINSGLKMMQDLASGITAGTSAVNAAIDGVLREIDARMPKSPPKKGPLAGSRYVDRSGLKLSTDFAAGISAGAGAVAASANTVAGGARTAFNQGAEGRPFKRLFDIIAFGQHIVDAFKRVTDIFLGAAKFFSDPLGQGTFFGKSLGGALGFQRDPSVSNAELARRRQDRQQQAATGQTGMPGTFVSDQALLANVPKGRYSQTGNADLVKGLGDCSSAVEDLVNIMDSRPTGGREMTTANAAEWLTAHGFQQGRGAPGDFRVGFNSGHMQATLPGGTPFNWGSDAAAAAGGRSGEGAFFSGATDFYFRKMGTVVADSVTQALSTDPNAHLGTGAEPGPLDPTQQRLTDIAKNTGESNETQAAMLSSLRQQDESLDKAIKIGQDPTSTDQQIASSLQTIQQSIDRQGVDQKDQKEALIQTRDAIAGDRGFQEAANPIDQATQIAGAAASIAGDIFKVINSAAEALVATKEITDTLVRGVSNTEDIMAMIDNFQKFIQLGADIAGAVSSITGQIGSLIGAGAAADPSGGASGAAAAFQAVSQIAALVQAGFETANALIDLGQEAYRIIGSYAGEFLGFLSSGTGTMLQGQVKYLLDQNTRQLYAYTQDNPAMKYGHNAPGDIKDPNAGRQGIGQINVYGGPGVDPRDSTRQMLYQVKAAGYAGATAQ